MSCAAPALAPILPPGRVRRAAASALMAAGLFHAGLVGAVGPTSATASAPSSAPARTAPSGGQDGPSWTELKPAQQAALGPLQAAWPGFDVRSKRKWVELADRFPKLGAAEQARVQARMGDWIRLTPAQRGQARFNFQQAKQLAPTDRQARWDAYQALAPEEKQKLAARSAAQASAPADPLRRAVPRAGRDTGTAATASGPAPVALPRAVGPALVQATPGASTTLIDRRPTPPEHQRAGKLRAGPPGDATGRAGAAADRARAEAPVVTPGVAPRGPSVTAAPPAGPPAPVAPPAIVPGAGVAPPAGTGPIVPVGPRSDTEPGAPGR